MDTQNISTQGKGLTYVVEQTLPLVAKYIKLSPWVQNISNSVLWSKIFPTLSLGAKYFNFCPWLQNISNSPLGCKIYQTLPLVAKYIKLSPWVQNILNPWLQNILYSPLGCEIKIFPWVKLCPWKEFFFNFAPGCKISQTLFLGKLKYHSNCALG